MLSYEQSSKLLTESSIAERGEAMSDKEAMTLALEALKYLATQIKPDYEHSKAIKALEEALASEQKQRSVRALADSEQLGEPVAIADGSFNCNAPLGTPLYATPQPAQKPWVGLTDEERGVCINSNFGTGLWLMAKDIEAKLKEKNT